MNVEVLPEPDLEFGTGTHIDIRFGIRDYGPVGFNQPTTAKIINVGFVGTAATVRRVNEWMTAARAGVAARPSKKEKFRPAFPGFGVFACDWATEERCQRIIDSRKMELALSNPSSAETIKTAAKLFIDECQYLDSETNVDVIICAPPNELLAKVDASRETERPVPFSRWAKASKDSIAYDLHDLVKAESLQLKIPIQYVRPPTYGVPAKQVAARVKPRGVQDAATRAWNFHTALYYKAGGTPWRLLRRTSDLESCYIGISFFRSIDKVRIHTSVAQVFNERGEGMILRGGEAVKSDSDLEPHLSKADMKALVVNALGQYEKEHHHLPARVVIHKTSGFSVEETMGCEEGLQGLKIHTRDLLVIRDSEVRLFRNGTYPPLRGTFLQIDDRLSLLYTRGSVPFFEMYPGLYVPRGLQIESVATEESPRQLAREILALTKMNWNNTQFDSSLPITIQAARQVGSILKYTSESSPIQKRYAFYM
ncbi:argonaute/piwi family protein [Nitrospira moscoviensis]|uniref:Protein argonaute n=1 Tax=Nitrospira moscoviensis TaxID=42253 RepID=A0A0K2GGQ5_NITMO|nr:hypothetical protein [Nitrospira moscoviensis]ALA60121.1 hypothetical protein NITMOv2_3729 [Nitrospira moscoviensis]